MYLLDFLSLISHIFFDESILDRYLFFHFTFSLQLACNLLNVLVELKKLNVQYYFFFLFHTILNGTFGVMQWSCGKPFLTRIVRSPAYLLSTWKTKCCQFRRIIYFKKLLNKTCHFRMFTVVTLYLA